MSAKTENKKTWKFVPIVDETYFPSNGMSLDELMRVVSKGEIDVAKYKARDESIGRAVRAGLIEVRDGMIRPTKKLKDIVNEMAKDAVEQKDKQEARLKATLERADKLREKLAKTNELAKELEKQTA
jgi:hypothetical protein